MTQEQQAINALIALQGEGDTEANHGNADDILCEFLKGLGYENIVDEYNKIDKWYAQKGTSDYGSLYFNDSIPSVSTLPYNQH